MIKTNLESGRDSIRWLPIHLAIRQIFDCVAGAIGRTGSGAAESRLLNSLKKF